MKNLNCSIRFDRLECLDYPKGRKSKPYLWFVFFKVDGSCVRLTDKFRLEGDGIFYHSEGSHGNLGGKEVGTGEHITIPSKVGGCELQLVPIHVPIFEQKTAATLGILAVLLEEHNVSDGGAEAGHNKLKNEVAIAVSESLEAFDPREIKFDDIEGSIQEYFQKRMDPYMVSIPKRVEKTIQKEQTLVQNLWSLVSKDQFIGVHVWNFSQNQLMLHNGRTELACEWNVPKLGHWKLRGEIQAS
jgi:hypothetical protein